VKWLEVFDGRNTKDRFVDPCREAPRKFPLQKKQIGGRPPPRPRGLTGRNKVATVPFQR